MPALNSEIERLLYQVNVIKMDAAGLAGGMSSVQFNWRPRPGVWSIGECLEHLNLINRVWLERIEASIQRGRAAGLLSDGPFAYGFLSRWFLKLMGPPVKIRVKAPKSFQPLPDLNREEVVAEFLAQHTLLGTALTSANGLDLKRTKSASPVTRHIRYSLGMAFWLLAAHDRRHIWQARQVAKAPGFPTSTS